MDPNIISKEIFRAYDIRGVVDETLTEQGVYLIGRVFGSEALEAGESAVFVARDGRLSGPLLLGALMRGIQSTGCAVIDLGMIPTPVLYFATFQFSELSRSGVMLTGSHNPKNHNGLKMVLSQNSVCLDAVTHLYDRICVKNWREGLAIGAHVSMDILPDYVEKIVGTCRLNRPLRVVVDAGSGVTGVIAPDVYAALGCQVIPLYCEVDGNFPHHHPDPSKPKNLEALIARVKSEKADVGLAFDGDGDRLGVVTPAGKIIWPDRQLMLYAKEVLSTHPGAEVIFDVKCSTFLADVIREAGGRPLMYKTGHSLIKQKLKETGAPLAGEMSGHTFFHDKWPGFDDGMYTGVRLLEILSRGHEDLDEIFDAFPEGVSTPEITLDIEDSRKFSAIEAMHAWVRSGDAGEMFSKANIIDIDGLRVEFPLGWGLVRASNTTPCLVFRFEAMTSEALSDIRDVFRTWVHHALNIDDVLPF